MDTRADDDVYSCFDRASGIMFVYDVKDKQSFKNLEVWFKRADMCTSERVVKFLIGSKLQNEDRVVSVDNATVYFK